MTEREEQRRSFAYGNTNIGNPRITREMVAEAAEAMRGKQPDALGQRLLADMQIAPHTAKAGVVTLGQLTGGPVRGRTPDSESLKEILNNEPNRLPVSGCLQLTSKYQADERWIQDAAVLVPMRDEAAPESSNARRDSKMNARKLVAVREFTDKQGQKHKIGDRIEVDPDYGQELIRRGEVKEEPSAEQQPAEQK
jgi:hypothetical protein